MRKDDELRRARRRAYQLFMVIALALIASRICSSTSVEKNTAFQGANDKSRWCTIASLVEYGTYSIDRVHDLKVQRVDRPDRQNYAWRSIDKVRHRGRDGKQHYYSSKPPLLPTLVAGVYAVVYHAGGLSMTEQPVYVPRIVLLLVNIPLVFLFFWCTIWSIDLVATGEWARRFGAAAVCFGTMITPFAVTLNNHLAAAAACAAVVYLYLTAAEMLDVDVDGQMRRVPTWLWLTAGLAAGFVAANELPALSMLCLWGVLFARLNLRGGVIFAGGAAIVVCAFFATNWMAHSSLRPPYMHRGNGAEIGKVSNKLELPQPSLNEIQKVLVDNRATSSNPVLDIKKSGEENRWLVQSKDNQKFALVKSDGRNPDWTLHHWDDWYDYDVSYWREDYKRSGVDVGEPSRAKYFFHMTFGHHGIFSLTPLWLLLPIGFFFGWAYGPKDFQRLIQATTIASVVCLTFYLLRPEIDRNYGGRSCCFRWMLWFAPLWLVVIAPVIDDLASSRRLRKLLLVLLALSVFFMSIPMPNPWQDPSLYQYWKFLGWIGG